MDVGLYPDYDLAAELRRAHGQLNYHRSEAEYFQGVVDALTALSTEEPLRQFDYVESALFAGVEIDDTPAAPVITDDMQRSKDLAEEPVINDAMLRVRTASMLSVGQDQAYPEL